MKKILLFLLLLSATSAFAQDVIVKKDGSTILSKVLKITANEVEYKKYSNQNGPTYTIAKAEVQAINYENGEKETFGSEPQNTQQKQTVQEPELQTFEDFKVQQIEQKQMSDFELFEKAGAVNRDDKDKAKKLRRFGWAVGGALVACGAVINGSAYFCDDDDMWMMCMILGPIYWGTGLITLSACQLRAHRLEKRFNHYIQSASLLKRDFTIHNGTSLSTSIDILKENRLKSNPTIGLGLRYNF